MTRTTQNTPIPAAPAVGIDCLASEVLFEIFEYACTSSTPIFAYPGPYMPYILTGVSLWWHDLAISHPVLWTDVHLFHFSAPSSPYGLQDLVKVLTWSQNHALHVHFDTEPLHHEFSRTFKFKDALGIIHPHMTRCRRLTITGDKTHYRVIYEALLGGCPTPLLQRLDLQGTDTSLPSHGFPSTYHFPAIRCDPQRLTHVYIDDISVWGGFMEILPSLKILDLRNSGAHYVYSCLHEGAIETLLLSNFSYDISSDHMICLPFLRYFKLENPKDVNIFFRCTLKLDSLTHLELSRFTRNIWDQLNRRMDGWLWLLTVERLTLSYFETESCSFSVRFMGMFPTLVQVDFISADPKPFLNILKAHPAVWPGVTITVDGEVLSREGCSVRNQIS